MTDTPWWHDDDAEPPAGGSDALGSAAAEAARLFEVLRERMMTDPNTLRAGMRMMEAFSAFTANSGGKAVPPGEAPECAYCPVCQAITHARNLDPQTVERLTGAAVEFADTIRRTVAQDSSAAAGDEVRHVPLDDEENEESERDGRDPVAEMEVEGFAGWPEPVDPNDQDPDDQEI